MRRISAVIVAPLLSLSLASCALLDALDALAEQGTLEAGADDDGAGGDDGPLGEGAGEPGEGEGEGEPGGGEGEPGEGEGEGEGEHPVDANCPDAFEVPVETFITAFASMPLANVFGAITSIDTSELRVWGADDLELRFTVPFEDAFFNDMAIGVDDVADEFIVAWKVLPDLYITRVTLSGGESTQFFPGASPLGTFAVGVDDGEVVIAEYVDEGIRFGGVTVACPASMFPREPPVEDIEHWIYGVSGGLGLVSCVDVHDARGQGVVLLDRNGNADIVVQADVDDLAPALAEQGVGWRFDDGDTYSLSKRALAGSALLDTELVLGSGATSVHVAAAWAASDGADSAFLFQDAGGVGTLDLVVPGHTRRFTHDDERIRGFAYTGTHVIIATSTLAKRCAGP